MDDVVELEDANMTIGKRTPVVAAELGSTDGDRRGFGSGIEPDLSDLEQIDSGGSSLGFAEELADLESLVMLHWRGSLRGASAGAASSLKPPDTRV